MVQKEATTFFTFQINLCFCYALFLLKYCIHMYSFFPSGMSFPVVEFTFLGRRGFIVCHMVAELSF